MDDKGTSPITLEYAIDTETGDLVASRLLARIVKAIIWIHILVLAAGLLVFAVYAARFGVNVTWWTVISIALVLAKCALLLRCLKTLRHTHGRSDGIFFVTFLVMLLYPAATFAWNSKRGFDASSLLSAGNYLATIAIEQSYLLLVPFLRGRESAAWLQRLTFVAIGVLALSMVPWLTNNVLRYLDPSMRGLYQPTFIRPTWVQAGVLVSMVALFALRHEHNRVLLRLVAIWWALFVVTSLYESRFWIRFAYQPSFAEVLPILFDLLRYAAASIPFSLLAWFTFRFSDSQRKAMGRRVEMAET